MHKVSIEVSEKEERKNGSSNSTDKLKQFFCGNVVAEGYKLAMIRVESSMKILQKILVGRLFVSI